MPSTRGALVTLALLLTAGCTITASVDPVPARAISSLCIVDNPKVWSKQFLPTLRDELARRGIRTTVHQGDVPPECIRRLEYEANWKWDIAVYMSYVDIRIYDEGLQVGRATYDARNAAAHLGKFGRGDEKLAELVDRLLADVNRDAATR
jgi:hypothetical protein